MKEPIEVLDEHDIKSSELKELEKIAERKDLNYSASVFEGAYLQFIRQHNFTICVVNRGEVDIVGVSKKHPDYDPQYNEEVGKKLALIRAFENFNVIFTQGRGGTAYTHG